MVRGQYIRLQDLAQIKRFREEYQNTDLFTSVARYEKPDNNSRGIVPLYFDIDSKDNLNMAREDAIRLCELLCDRIGISYDSLEIYFSGYKGFHVIVPVEIFVPRYSGQILSLLKILAQRAQAIGILRLDTGVYTAKRILRFPNSKHSLSQLYKIPLMFKELRDVGMDGILNMAQNPRSDDSYVNLNQNAQAVAWYEKAIRVMEKKSVDLQPDSDLNHPFRSGWRKPPCIRTIEKATIPEGFRHNLYYQLARYYSWIGMHPEGIVEQIEEIDIRNPIEDPEYITRTVMSGCQKSGFPGCDNEVLKNYCDKDKCFYYKLKSGEKNENSNCKIM